MDRYLVVLAGAGLGGLIRYIAGTWIMEKAGGRFPAGTFLINVSGSFLIGIVMTLLTERWAAHPNWRLLLVVGVLGGYTTFSSFEFETLQSMRQGLTGIAALYSFGSLLLGYAAVWLGAEAASRL